MTITVEWHYALCFIIFCICFWIIHYHSGDTHDDKAESFTIAFIISCVPNFVIMVVQYEAKRRGWW